MPRSEFSVIIVPESTGRIIKRTFAKWKVIAILVSVSLFIICSVLSAIGYFKADIDKQKLISLEKENKYLTAKIGDLQESVETIKGRMADIIKNDENIRLVFDLPSIDPSIREVGIGGPEYGTMEFDSPAAQQLTFAERDIDKILRQINLETASFGDVYDKIQSKKDILDHTPSIMPCEGFITSGVGVRRDPFTGMMAQHNGIDIAASKGTPVYAPAAGTITRCGWDRGMGNFIIINHGNNLKTYYGHLSLIKVRNGQRVSRMDLIGLIGSTGRSTGPHLHYEVRKYDRPTNPRDYFIKSIIYNS
jgi:murein DD-endopeptidase MepM/ murein hydrolase activator NlpD